MNDRIKLLAEQAGIIPGIMGLNRFTHFDPEKLAKLIVAECARIVTDAVDHCEPASTYADRIKQHFGVKDE